MNTNMTERDKKLLVGMLIGVLIVAIGYWGIIPQIKAYSELGTSIEKEEETQKLNKMKIANTSLIEMQAEDYEKKLAGVKDDFYQILTSAEVDQMLTELATKRKLYIYDLKFSMPKEPSTRTAYIYSGLFTKQQEMIKAYKDAKAKAEKAEKAAKKAEEEAKKEGDDSSSKTSSKSKETTKDLMETITGAEEGGYQPNTQIYAVPVSFTVGGEVAALEDFLEEVSDMDKTVLLTSYSWGEFRSYVVRDAYGNVISDSEGTSITQETTTEDETVAEPVAIPVNTKARKTLTVCLEIYMCDTKGVGTEAEGTEKKDSTEAESKDEDKTEETSQSAEEMLNKAE